MGDVRRSRPVVEQRPIESEGVPSEERIDPADAAERVDREPEEQENREEVDPGADHHVHDQSDAD